LGLSQARFTTEGIGLVELIGVFKLAEQTITTYHEQPQQGSPGSIAFETIAAAPTEHHTRL
jgi:hypothetical protein